MDSGKTQKPVHVENLSKQLNTQAEIYLKYPKAEIFEELYRVKMDYAGMQRDTFKKALGKEVIEFMKNEVKAQLSGANTPLADFFKDVETFADLQKGIKVAKEQLNNDKSEEVLKVLEGLEALNKSCGALERTIDDLSIKIQAIRLKENFSWGDNIARFAENIVWKAIPKILVGTVFLIDAAIQLLTAAAICAVAGFIGASAGAAVGAVAGPVGAAVGIGIGALGGAGVGALLADKTTAVSMVLMLGEEGAKHFMGGINAFCNELKIDPLKENHEIKMGEVKVALEKFIEETIQPQLLKDVANSIQASAKVMEASASRNA